jgi:hypothetical protein
MMKNILRYSQFINEGLELEKVEHSGKLYHLSNYLNRESILRKGLEPRIGTKTSNWQKGNKTEGLENFVYLLQNEPSMLEKSLYGFDVWEIDPDGLNLELFVDPNHTEFGGWFVTRTPIPPSNMRLIDSDEKYDDCVLNRYIGSDKPEHCKDLDPERLLGF